MARALMRASVNAGGVPVVGALAFLYLHGTQTPVSDAWDSETGGTQVTSVLSDSQGDLIAWIDGPKRIDLKVTDNTDRAYKMGAVGELLTFADFTETVDVHEDPSDYAVTANVVTLAGTQTITGAKTFEAVTDFDTHVRFKTRPWVDVTHPDFGAVGDGVTDDYTAINAALSAVATGGTVFFPAGTYMIGTALATGNDPAVTINIVGAGRDRTILKAVAGSAINQVLSLRSPGIVQDLTVDGNATAANCLTLLNLSGQTSTISHMDVARVICTNNRTNAAAWLLVVWDQDSSSGSQNNRIRECHLTDVTLLGPGSTINDCFATSWVETVYAKNMTFLNNGGSLRSPVFFAGQRVIIDGIYSDIPNTFGLGVDSWVNEAVVSNVVLGASAGALVINADLYSVNNALLLGTAGVVGGYLRIKQNVTGGTASKGTIRGGVFKRLIADNVVQELILADCMVINDTTDNGPLTLQGVGTYGSVILHGNVIDSTGNTGGTNWLRILNSPTIGLLEIHDNRVYGGATGIAETGTITARSIKNNPGYNLDLTSVSANTTLSDRHETVLVDATGAARTITLPTAAAGRTGKIYIIKKIDSSTNAVTVDASGAETIDGALTYVLRKQYSWVAIRSDGTNWAVETDGIGGFTRTDSTTITTTDKVLFGGEIEIDGALNHDGATAGFGGVAPTAIPAANTTDLKDLLALLGFLTNGGATPLNLDGGVLTAGGLTLTGRLDQTDFATFANADTTPSVLAGNLFKTANAGATSITTFDDGVNGQEITVVFTDANTTLVNGATLKLAGAVNFVSTADDTMTLVHDGTAWREKSRSVN